MTPPAEAPRETVLDAARALAEGVRHAMRENAILGVHHHRLPELAAAVEVVTQPISHEASTMRTSEIGNFHNRDGWYFKRLADGSVRIQKTTVPHVDAPVGHEHVIPENEWASIVAHVSARGETGETWSAAREIHAGTLNPAAMQRALKEIFAVTEPLALLLAMGDTPPAAELLAEVQKINRLIADAQARHD